MGVTENWWAICRTCGDVRIDGSEFKCDACSGPLVVALDGRYSLEEAMQVIRCASICTTQTMHGVLCPRCKQPINGPRLCARWRLPIPVISWAIDLLSFAIAVAAFIGSFGLVYLIDRIFAEFRLRRPFATLLEKFIDLITPRYSKTVHFCPPHLLHHCMLNEYKVS